MADLGEANSWIRIVEAILSGKPHRQPYVRMGSTPNILRACGLGPFDIVMRPGKIARAAREHPEIPRHVWHRLPVLLATPSAVIPSAKRDGTIIPVLALGADLENPILVPILADAQSAANIVLSIYEKRDGHQWVKNEIDRAKAEGLNYFVAKGFAATLPQPGSVSDDTIPSSPDPISADGTTKPKREILQIRKKSTES